MKLLPPDDPLLRTPAKPVTFDEPFDHSVPRKMAMFMDMEGGVGLAATQVGIPLRFFVMKLTDNKVILVINPSIIFSGAQVVDGVERCLSFPGMSRMIPRKRVIDVEFQSPGGRKITMTLKGKDARVFQHELDHLNGICIIPADEVPDPQKPQTLTESVPTDPVSTESISPVS